MRGRGGLTLVKSDASLSSASNASCSSSAILPCWREESELAMVDHGR